MVEFSTSKSSWFKLLSLERSVLRHHTFIKVEMFQVNIELKKSNVLEKF